MFIACYMKNVYFLFVCVFISVPFLKGQSKFTKKETDSVVKKLQYLRIEESQSKQAINDIDNALPRLATDSAKLALLRQKAYLFSRLRDEPNVLKTYLASKKLIDKTGSDRELIMYHLALAEVYSHLKMFKLSLENLDVAKKILEKESNNPKIPMHQYAYIALKQNALFESRAYEDCIKFGKEVLPQFTSIENLSQKKFMTMLSNQLIAFSYLELQDYDHVLPYLERSIELDKDQIYEFQLKNNTAYGRYLFETGKVDSALAALSDFKLKEKTSYPDAMAARSNLLAKIYSAKNKPQLSEIHINKKDSLNRSTQDLEIKAAEESVKHVEREKKNTIESKNSLIYFFLLPLLGLSIGVTIYLSKKKKKEKEEFEKIIQDLKTETFSASTFNKSEKKYSDTDGQKNITSGLSEDKESELLEGLKKFEEKEKFREVTLTLSSLASNLKTNRTYLSEVIRKYKGGNYNTYINELRINYIVKKLYTTPEYWNYKISFLAEDSGFVSHSSFTTVFKSIIGISPSVFIQNLRNNKNV